MNWICKSWVFYILLYRSDFDFTQLRKDDLVQILNTIRLHYINRVANDDLFDEFSNDFKEEIKFWLGGRFNEKI